MQNSGAAPAQLLCFAMALLVLLFTAAMPAGARSHSKKAAAPLTRNHAVESAIHHKGAHHAAEVVSHRSSSHHTAALQRTSAVVAHSSRGRHGRTRNVVSYEGNKKTIVAVHRGRHRRGEVVTHEVVRVVRAAPRPRYAYPLSFFLLHPPEFERGGMPSDLANKISRSFHQGYADSYTARSLVRAGIVSYHPLRGGIFWRREPVKYIIMHSTETGIPIGAERVIESWSSSGLRHAGAQYVVERDGTIFQAVDPDLGTVHINIFKTLPGINNDNSIGIEMCHTGRQDYPAAQRESVVKLVSYLQERYKVSDENVITHRYAQQGDHTDPVNFDWDGFIANKNSFRNRAIAYKVRKIKDEVKDWNDTTATTPETIPTVREYNSASPYSAAPNSAVSTFRTTTTTTTTTASPPLTPTSTTPSSISPEASTYLQPHKIMKEPVVPPTAPRVVPEQTMILIPPKPESVEPYVAPATVVPPTAAAPKVAPMVLPKNMPSLRGPIEMAPQEAPGLNATPGDSGTSK